MQAAEFASCRHDSPLYHRLSDDKFPFRLGRRDEREAIANGLGRTFTIPPSDFTSTIRWETPQAESSS